MTGRERAIETLIDSDPHGAFYRASRVLDEVVPHSLGSRPNLITRSALVEEAFKLKEYEINNSRKYREAFEITTQPSKNKHSENSERVLRHFRKLSPEQCHKIPLQLVASLRRWFDQDTLPTLLKEVMTHHVEDKNANEKDEKGKEDPIRMEPMIAHVCKEDDKLHGLLISILGVLTSCLRNEAGALKEGSEKSVPPMPPLRVGSVLSLLKPDLPGHSSPFQLDEAILDYLEKAAAVHEERIEIQEARVQERQKQDTRNQTPADDASPSTVPPEASVAVVADEEDGDKDDEDDDEEEDEDDDEGNDIDLDLPGDDAALSAAVFEQIISAVTGDDDASLDGVDRAALRLATQEESSESDCTNSDDDENSDAVDRYEIPEDSPHDEDSENGMIIEEESEEEDAVDSMLRQALAISLTEHTPLSEQHTPDSEGENVPVTPRPELETIDSQGRTPESTEPETPELLPQLPTPPSAYPYAEYELDLDDQPSDELSGYLDPEDHEKFGSMPASFVLVRLFQNVLTTINTGFGTLSDDKVVTPPGGVGCSLFNTTVVEETTDMQRTQNSTGVSIQLLLASFLEFNTARLEAIEGLRQAVLAEQSNASGGHDDDNQDGSSLHLSDEEEDDPAVVLAMRASHPDASSLTESLEAKGMTRKAAAAAQDAALRIKSLRKETDEWKNRVKLFSYCTLMSMSCFTSFVRSTISSLLEYQTPELPFMPKDLFPRTTLTKLADAISGLMDAGLFRSYLVLLTGESELESLVMASSLYRNAISCWGEAIPLIFPSHVEREKELRFLLNECFSNTNSDLLRTTKNTVNLPPTPECIIFSKLDALCRRMCVTDLLEDAVARPKCLSLENEGTAKTLKFENVTSPVAASTIVELLGKHLSIYRSAGLDFVSRLHFAMCHRCIAQGILWDGLFACSQTEPDDSMISASSNVGTECIRVASTPSSCLPFDASKCSDSIAILINNSDSTTSGTSAHQRASKVWGTVLSSSFFAPKTGVHRWAVRLDRCERGHVFVGVATSQASMRTYVGGDKYGWGVIGTQALWHDRRKIRGDYGATFRTGSVIIVTLDTDAGTLSFSSWKDSSGNSSSFSLDPLAFSSPRRQGSGPGTIEDWGIAFEGLPLDARLYPAVGLYQRDDRVTLLTVESGGGAGSGDIGAGGDLFSSGVGYFPRFQDNQNKSASLQGHILDVRTHNDYLSLDSILFVSNLLKRACAAIHSGNEESYSGILRTTLPSVAASISLIPPSIPVLTQRFCLAILPLLTECTIALKELIDKDEDLFPKVIQEGKWVIRATGSTVASSATEGEEYVVNFDHIDSKDGTLGVAGSGVGTTGKSKNGFVTIKGTVDGSALYFLEEWTDGSESSPRSDDSSSSCVVSARLNLDGTKFEGTYRNVQYGTTGQIAGFLRESEREVSKKSTSSLALACQLLLCYAHGQMASIIGCDQAGDLVGANTIDQARVVALKDLLASNRVLSEGPLANSGSRLQERKLHLMDMYKYPITSADERETLFPEILSSDLHAASATNVPEPTFDPIKFFLEHDSLFSKKCGVGSFSKISPEEYKNARMSVVSALMHHNKLSLDSPNNTVSSDDESCAEIWGKALSILEREVRTSISMNQHHGTSLRETFTKTCQRIGDISLFLLSLEPCLQHFSSPNEVNDAVSQFYCVLENTAEINFVKEGFDHSLDRAILRLMGLAQLSRILRHCCFPFDSGDAFVVEALSVALPRLLGRGQSGTIASSSTRKPSQGADLGKYFMAGIEGSGRLVRSAIRENICGLLEKSKTFVAAASDEKDLTSLLLAVLPVFALCFRSQDVEVVRSCNILSSIQNILSGHRESLQNRYLSQEVIDGTEGCDVILDLKKIIRRDGSRALMKSALSVAHVFCFQVGQHSSLILSSSQACRETGELLLHELTQSIMFTNGITEDHQHSYLKDYENEQYEGWLKLAVNEREQSKSAGRNKLSKFGVVGLKYLLENGTHAVLSSGQLHPGKQQPARLANHNTTRQFMKSHGERQLCRLGLPCQQHLSHCLNLLNALAMSEKCLLQHDNKKQLLKVLIEATGIVCHIDDSGELLDVKLCGSSTKPALLPARFRARILRLLRSFVSQLDPSSSVIESLFLLVGSFYRVNGHPADADERTVLNEVISTIRWLHSPSHPSWRTCIESFIEAQMACAAASEIRLGILGFVGGDIKSVNQGSYVLLKPTAAAPLSADVQAAPSSKSHNSSNSNGAGVGAGVTPHHIVGNGTEGIIAGLCRSDAAAGIVSSIDLKTAMCEVVLIERNSDGADVGVVSLAPKHTMTIRAVRSPLTDIAVAEEVPLYLDDSFPTVSLFRTLLAPGLKELTQSIKRGEAVDQMDDLLSPRLHLSLLLLRSAIVLLSEERTISRLQSDETWSESFACILELAAMQKHVLPKALELLPSESLATIPIHEGKYVHFKSIISEIHLQQTLLRNVDDATWKDRALKVAENTKPLQGSNTAVEGEQGENAAESLATTASNQGGKEENEAEGRPASQSNTRVSGASSARAVSQSSVSTNSTDDEEDNEAAATAAAHLREAAIAQMAELGLPRSWSELALRRTGGTNIEAAVHFCLERGGDMERLVAEERERDRMRSTSGSASSRRRNRGEGSNSSHLLRQLLEMGFPSRWCAEALAATRNNVDEALTWILTNGERLSAEDEGMDDGEDDEMDDDVEDDEDDSAEEEETGIETEPGARVEEAPPDDGEIDVNEAKTKRLLKDEEDNKTTKSQEDLGWAGSVTPLRFISGRSIIDPKSLAISGLPTGGFSSVGTKGVLLTEGKWYYEAILETAGCLQIGWADGSFSGHCNADRGDGCGDGPSSWAYDGWRRYRWHASATEWGCRWKEGDVVGCLVDLDSGEVGFTLNGLAEEIGMGVAFSGKGFRPCGGVYACVSFNRREKLRLILGGEGNEAFKHGPPVGYRGVGEAVLERVVERDILLEKEVILKQERESNLHGGDETPKRFLCDFSDGEHGHELFAWQHRYYGSDASVHLGSGRNSKSSGPGKNSNGGGSGNDFSSVACVARMKEIWWKKSGLDHNDASSGDKSKDSLQNGLETLSKVSSESLFNEIVSLGTLYARKLVLHIIIVLGSRFSIKNFTTIDEVNLARDLWHIIDTCVSLRSAGWIGEAGAMAIAAEALGLGISSTESQFSSQSHDRPGLASVTEGDDPIMLPVAGISQVLSTTLLGVCETSSGMYPTSVSLAASAEAAIGAGGGGGCLVFLQRGLQNALSSSEKFKAVVIAIVRRSVRLLAVVDYSGDDSNLAENSEDDEEADGPTSSYSKNGRNVEDSVEEVEKSKMPDARLACFLTGLLLSQPVFRGVEKEHELLESLVEAWSVGLLSASAPWRMVCALTVTGILNLHPKALSSTIASIPTISNFYFRLHSTVVRRVWAERAAVPICSRYLQALIDLLASVRGALHVIDDASIQKWKSIALDAATPFPFTSDSLLFPSKENKDDDAICWEWRDGWISNDHGWETWTGFVEFMVADWKPPSRSAVRTLMDGGEGPPMLREGCIVMRGLDWDNRKDSKGKDEDGKSLYEKEKTEREKEKRSQEEQSQDIDPADPIGGSSEEQQNPAAESNNENDDASGEEKPSSQSQKEEKPNKKKKRKKIPNPKLPTGTVLSIEPWNGVPAMARRVRWHLTGEEDIYRYGGDGGRFDICHVETNRKGTRVRKRHPLPESAEQCVARHGFGSGRKYSVLLRIRPDGREEKVNDEIEMYHKGILEYPDFGAAVRVECILHADGAVTLTEKELLYGSKDSGWEARFGQPSYLPDNQIILSPSGSSTANAFAEMDTKSSFLSMYEELLGSSSYFANGLRHRADGSRVRVTSEMRLLRGRRPLCEVPKFLRSWNKAAPPIYFDKDFHPSFMSLSRDGRTLTCVSSDGRGTAFASVGFTKGVHYWEVKLEQADIGSVYIGVAEKPNGSTTSGTGFASDGPPRLNRWLGWGFVNFRATYTAGAERVYGAHCHNEDTVGVLLDCDAGRVSFFYDGLKYGEHILNDLGCAFENISPFGFNADGCGSGGAGQGAPSGIDGGRGGRYPAHGIVRPRALWPVVGLRNPGDRVTLSAKWSTSVGTDGVSMLRNTLAVNDVLRSYDPGKSVKLCHQPDWLAREAFHEYKQWRMNRWYRSVSRGSGPHRYTTSGLDLDLDTSPIACASACAGLGLRYALLAGDRVVVKRSAGRQLELAEEAIVLGAYQGRLYYRLVSQKSEGGSLNEGGGRAWFWDESEVVDNSLQLVGKGLGLGISLPIINRFRCMSSGGLKIIYDGGAVIRSDLEIFDRSANLGTVPSGTIIQRCDVLERRVNSCGVVRYRVRYGSIKEGWISSRIRGGKEEAIVEPVFDDSIANLGPCFPTVEEAALAWYKQFEKESGRSLAGKEIASFDEFIDLLTQSSSDDVTAFEYDSTVSKLMNAIADHSESGDGVDCSFPETFSSVSFALACASNNTITSPAGKSIANAAAAEALGGAKTMFSSSDAVMARIALLRAFNRRARMALPWLSMRPSQEGTAIFGGLCGHGASVERVGRNKLVESMSIWVQVPSIASWIRCLKPLFFTSVKLGFLESIMDATTTPTPLSHDEYELPREIRTVRVNRLKARRAAAKDQRAKRKHSVFSQLQNETRTWGGAALRRGFVAKGHGGQKRAFKVKLVGEGVNDYSGPYREVFTDAMHEVLEHNGAGQGILGVLDPTPNNTLQVGECRDLFMFSRGEHGAIHQNKSQLATEEEYRIKRSFASLMMARDESSREVEESLVFLGRLVGTACRHGIPVDLPLPMHTVWNVIAEEEKETHQDTAIMEIDAMAGRQNNFSMLQWQQRMLNSFVDGLSHVLPVEVLSLLSGKELRAMLCGNPDVNVDLLKRVVEYEGYEESDGVIGYFWEALREMSSADRKKFLQFVWARSRLPNKESDFEAPFKIQKHTGGEDTLPSASTCFFSLMLPNYSSKEVLKQKLLFAIENVCTMESDYVTNDAEVAEGWRGI